MLEKETESEDFSLGASHADKIGSIIILDIETDAENGKVAKVGVRGGLIGERRNRLIVSGVLRSSEDCYDNNGDVNKTILDIGETVVIINWDDDVKVSISTIAE